MRRAQVSGISILVSLLIIALALIIAKLFLAPLNIVAVNFLILYFLFLRAYSQIKKHKRAQEYIIAAVAAGLIMILTKNFLPLWSVTTWALLSCALVELYIALFL